MKVAFEIRLLIAAVLIAAAVLYLDRPQDAGLAVVPRAHIALREPATLVVYREGRADTLTTPAPCTVHVSADSIAILAFHVKHGSSPQGPGDPEDPTQSPQRRPGPP